MIGKIVKIVLLPEQVKKQVKWLKEQEKIGFKTPIIIYREKEKK